MDSLQNVLRYFKSGKIDSSDHFYFSENRGEFIPRLSKLAKFLEEVEFDPHLSSLIVACAGEIGNNSFDHNLGYWKDKPGLTLGWNLSERSLTVGLADRGRGIVQSLRPVVGEGIPSQEVLKLAFETVVSGRAPERRGNGLKFVCKSLTLNPLNSLVCFSNGHFYNINSCSKPVPTLKDLNQNFGTLFYLQWSLQ
ncbi:MAG: hypothetical protein JNM39_11445 [Bdellovibrionaceae bacterium]|nr:hypothetical protein [Pseudobdellovibrionaceae bacterium]